jgi:hypothetical protein
MKKLILLAAFAAVTLTAQTSGELVSQDLFITGAAAQSAAGNNVLLSTAGTTSNDTMVPGLSHYRALQVQIVASAGISGGAVIFEYSSDNVTFFPLQMYEASTAATLGASTVINAATTIAASTNRTFLGKVMGRYIRCRISTVFAGGTIQAFTRLAISDFQPWITALAGSQTLATVSTVTSASLSAASVTDIASAALTTTATSAAVAVTNVQSAAFAVNITAVSGTNPTLDVVIQCSVNTTTWQDIYHFERATASATLITPNVELPCAQIRYVRTVGGSSPSFTMSLTRWSKNINGDEHKNFFDRTIVANTLSSATPSFWVEGTDAITAIVSSAAATTAASFQMEMSADGTNWATIGTAVASVANTTTVVFNGPVVTKFARVRVSAAGSGQTLNYVSIQAR